MDLLVLVIVLCIIGFVIYLLTTYIPMPPQWAKAIQVIALVILLLYLVTQFIHIPNVMRR
jgi:hypothetical protein